MESSASEKNSTTFITEEEFDLREIFKTLWSKRIIIGLVSLLSLMLATVYAFVIAKPVFESSALLLPTQAPASNDLGAAAALLGKKSGSSGDLDLYQSLLTSRTVIHKLLLSSMPNRDDSAKGASEPLFKILNIDTAVPFDIEMATYSLSNSISVGTKASGEGGILEVRIAASQPWLAQEIGNFVLEIGQEELCRIRGDRADVILPQLALVVNRARSEWDSAAKNLTWYRDRNRSIVLPEQLLAVSRLEIEKQAKEQKYLLVRKEYEMQMLEKSKATPPMMILDPANLPPKKSRPKRGAILIAGLFLGLIGSSIAILAWKTLNVGGKSKR